MREHELEEIEKQLKEIKKKLDHLERKLDHLLKFFGKAKSLVLEFQLEGENMGNQLTVHLSDVPGVASAQEFTGLGGTGIPVPAIGPVVFASDNPAVATVDPSTGQLAYIGSGDANISATDQGNGLTDSALLTVNADVAQSMVTTLTPGVALPTSAARGKKK